MSGPKGSVGALVPHLTTLERRVSHWGARSDQKAPRRASCSIGCPRPVQVSAIRDNCADTPCEPHALRHVHHARPASAFNSADGLSCPVDVVTDPNSRLPRLKIATSHDFTARPVQTCH